MDGRSVVDFFYYYGTGPDRTRSVSVSASVSAMAADGNLERGKDDRFTTQSHSNNRIQV